MHSSDVYIDANMVAKYYAFRTNTCSAGLLNLLSAWTVNSSIHLATLTCDDLNSLIRY